MDLERIGELGFEKISVWYMLVLVLSFSFWWNAFIVAQCFLIFVYGTFAFAFQYEIVHMAYVEYVLDVLYTADVMFALSYCLNKKLKKLKYARSRHWTLLALDIISLLPTEMMFKFHIYSDIDRVLLGGIISQNRSIRIYRIFLLERDFMGLARSPWKYVLFTYVLFLAKVYVVAHLLSCIWVNVNNAITCDPKKYYCYMWRVINMMNVVLMNWTGPNEMFTSNDEQILLLIALILSFLLVYAYIYPYTFYFSVLVGCRDSTIAENNRRLKKFLENMIKKSDLRQRILHYFDYLWAEGEGDSELKEVLKHMPICFQKELNSDIYWEAFRHSDLLRDTSRSFKRSLSLNMTTDYHHEGEVIYQKGEEKRRMIFVVQGTIQVMAEENQNSPLLSFSSGTLIGELSLFLFTKSKALVKCKGYCELQSLNYRGLLDTFVDYPKDRRKVTQKFKQRILLAKYTQWRKKRFKEDQRTEMLTIEPSYFRIIECVKWLKMQWRYSWECQKRHMEVLKAKAEGSRLSSWRMPVKPEIRIDFVSNYLDLIVLSNLMEEKKGLFCLKNTFPWSIDPSTQFLYIWRYIILVTSFIPPLLYPVCTGWCDTFPPAVYSMSYIVTFFYIVDVGLKLFTAVVTKHETITKFSEVIRINLQRPTFYCDVIAALPYQAYILYCGLDIVQTESYRIGLLLHPAICKAYVFILWGPSFGNYVYLITFFKNCIICVIIIYWIAEIIQLYCVRNLFSLKDDDWIIRYLNVSVYETPEEKKFLREYLVSLYRALIESISMPSSSIYSDTNVDLFLTCLIRYLFFVFFCYFSGSFYSDLLVKTFGAASFRLLMVRLRNFLLSKHISVEFVQRIVKGIEFQWQYSRGDFIVNDVPIVQSMPPNIRKEVILETTFKTLKSCDFFKEESTEYLLEVLDYCDVVAVPSGLVLVTFGHNSHILTVLNRGYCQLNSHLTKDISSNLGRPIIIGPGYAFPVLSSFTNTPSSISVVTVSDCELIMIDLNKLITLMMKYNIFKDIVQAVEDEDLVEKLLDARPALMKICSYKAGIDDELEAEDFGYFRMFCYKIGKKFLSFMSTTFLTFWTYFYMFFLIIESFFWPSSFGLLMFHFHIIIPVFSTLKVLIIVNMTILSCFPYYNKNGLMVTHPLRTFLNYFTSSFVLDFIRLFPMFSIYLYGFCGPHEMPHFGVFLLADFQCLLGLVYVLGCIGHFSNLYGHSYYTKVTKILLVFFLGLHNYVNICMFKLSQWTFGRPHQVIGFKVNDRFKPLSKDLLRENVPSDFYLYTSYWILTSFNTSDFSPTILTGVQLFLTYFHGLIGTFLCYYMYVNLSSSSKFIKMGAAEYREEFSCLLRYLDYEKSEDRVVERVKVYYKYLWTKTGGENIKELFGNLPLCLLEELWYPLYRPTFVKNDVFYDANEGFFRILSTHVVSVFFTRGSVITFKNEAQSYIYFLHRGKCFVYDWFRVLDVGAIVGDVHESGLMQNLIYALTHVEMLKIESDLFFTIINNFEDLEGNFKHVARTAESFIETDTRKINQVLRPFDSRDALNAFGLKNKEISFEDESHFEDPGNTTSEAYESLTQRQGKQEKYHFIIYPFGWRIRIYSYLSVADILCTILIVPWFFMFGAVSLVSFITFAIVDGIWLVIVILTFLVGLVDHEKGDVITNHVYIAKKYLTTAFPLDCLSLIPFEVIPVLIAGSRAKTNSNAVLYLRLFRYFRVIGFYFFRDIEVGLLRSEAAKKITFMVVSFLWTFISLTAIFVSITADPTIAKARNHLEVSLEQIDAGIRALVYLTNVLVSSNIPTIEVTVRPELLHFNICCIIFVLYKGWLMNSILSIMYHSNLATFNYKTKANKLEQFLTKKDTSPILIRGAIDYETNLFRFSHYESLSDLLVKIPMALRMAIMKDLYIQHLLNFPLFNGLGDNFLTQLIARSKREIYFPGDKIVEQGDVDHRFYFIHSGEVYIVNQTKQRAYTEYVVGMLNAGEYFGEGQGLWIPKPHAYTYRARTLVEIISLFSDDWMDLRRVFPDTSNLILEKAKALKYL